MALIPLPRLVTFGAFGAAVGDVLQQQLNTDEPIPLSAVADLTRLADRPIIFLSACAKAAACDAIDVLMRRSAQPWLSVVMEHPVLRIGPALRATQGPCHSCFSERRLQHTQIPRHTRALQALYDAGPSEGPLGYLPHHVQVAAALAQRQWLKLLVGKAQDGEILLLDVLSGRLSCTHVVAVHGCDRCSPRDRCNDSWAAFSELQSQWEVV